LPGGGPASLVTNLEVLGTLAQPQPSAIAASRSGIINEFNQGNLIPDAIFFIV
jgi:hypothetical protein